MCPWSVDSSIPVLGLELRGGLSLEGLSLASDFFLCPWPWPHALCCALDSTSVHKTMLKLHYP